jgi:thioredoxin-related protein
MKYWWQWFLALSVGVWLLPAQADESKGFFDATWGNLQEELENAKDTDKKGIFLFFEMEDCPFCKRMKQTVFNQPQVQAYYRAHFGVFPIDIEGDVEVTDFDGTVTTSKVFAQNRHRVRATPVMIFFDLEGQPLYRHTGPTRDAEEFLWMAEYVLDGHYQSQPFGRFRQHKREQQ